MMLPQKLDRGMMQTRTIPGLLFTFYFFTDSIFIQ